MRSRFGVKANHRLEPGDAPVGLNKSLTN